MIVRYWITRDVATVRPDTPLLEAHERMRTRRVRRLPVVEGGRVVGILSRSDLQRHLTPTEARGSASDAIETNLAGRTVRDEMTAHPATCHVNDPIEDVGAAMRDRKIGAMPVVDGEERLVGIITESDVLTALAAITRGGPDTARVTLRLAARRRSEAEGVEHELARIVTFAAKHGVEIRTFITHEVPDEEGGLLTLRAAGGDARVEGFLEDLRAQGFDLLDRRH